jgi:hypothetical protein
LLNPQHVTRHLLNAFRDGPPVLATEGKRPEYEEIQSPLWKINMWRGHASPFTSTRKATPLLVEVQGERSISLNSILAPTGQGTLRAEGSTAAVSLRLGDYALNDAGAIG